MAQRHLLLGLQLYTVRADLAKDYEGTLKLVKAAGVRKVQLLNGKYAGRCPLRVQKAKVSHRANQVASLSAADIVQTCGQVGPPPPTGEDG